MPLLITEAGMAIDANTAIRFKNCNNDTHYDQRLTKSNTVHKWICLLKLAPHYRLDDVSIHDTNSDTTGCLVQNQGHIEASEWNI